MQMQMQQQQQQQQQKSVVLFPSLGLTNHIPMVELAKVFISHGFSVTYVLINPPFDTSSTLDPFISRAVSANPSILVHRLPKITANPSRDTNPLGLTFNLLRTASLQLLDYLKASESTPTVRALVLDMFNSAGLDVGAELGIPSYMFFPQSATSLAVALSLPTLQSQLEEGCSFRDLGDSTKVNLPGIPPISVHDLPQYVHDRDDANGQFMANFERLWTADGFVVNTYEWLDKRAVRALVNDGECVPGRRTPPVYCVGPLIAADGDKCTGEVGCRHECLEWLDAQPEKSVVYISFGTSGGSFSKEELEEIAVGLERSGQRFLWVVRSPVLLPEGFLERTREQGMVKPWAPQVAVLGHGSVGAFVSHCGWNSSLEAAAAGVPVIAWPRGAEQCLNKVHLVEEKKLAVAMEGYDKGMVVSASQVERVISYLMDSEEGRAIRDRLAESKAEAAKAWKEGGSSALAWSGLLKSLEKGRTVTYH